MVISLIVLLSAVSFSVACSATPDCEGGIISAGDMRVDPLVKCGEAGSKASHEEEISERLD